MFNLTYLNSRLYAQLIIKRNQFSTEKFKTPFTIYNSLSRKYEILETSSPNKLTWYICGPTVYDDAHLGHARTYLCFDVIRRIMERRGIYVLQVMNMTDVDDKILVRSKERGIKYQEFITQYIQSFQKDMSSLEIKPPTLITRVSEYIPEIIHFIEKILENNYAYQIHNDVYFDVQRFCQNHTYGKLQPSRHESKYKHDTEHGSISHLQSKVPTSLKRDVRDFALWKGRKEHEEEECLWESPWGIGRPGWHIECSAMCT
jgi:cysteinyl-tRNA synthetase